MKKLFSKENITNLGISIIGSIIFMQLVTPAMQIIKNMGNGVVTALVNYYYFSCGHASSTEFISTVAYIVLLLIFSILMGVLSSISFPSSQKEEHEAETTQTTFQPKDANNTMKDIANQLVEIENEVTQMQERIKDIEMRKNKSQKHLAILARILLILFTLNEQN